ncbi:hypothetical protein GBA52_014406 [Prunus armeniaca]|nr:hypothetical protein GBA52_014406 [Prunus armeniaca]
MKVFTTPTSLDRVLEPSPDMKESVMAVEKIVDYNFKNKKLLEEALTHPSVAGSASYQRLEVLGDSALNHAVTNYFFCMADHQKFTQGQITKLRSANTENLNLARVAVRHGLYRYLRRQNTSDLDDQKFKPLLEPIFTLENLPVDPRTELNEFCQKNRKLYEIKLRPRHETRDVSIADVYVDGEFFASGWSNKKEGAKRNAAIEAVNKLFQSVVVDDGSFQGSAVGNNMSFRIEEAIQGLHVLCVKKRLPKSPEYNKEADRMINTKASNDQQQRSLSYDQDQRIRFNDQDQRMGLHDGLYSLTPQSLG